MSVGPIIGLFGISGVGKSWLSAKLIDAMHEILHVQASALLRHEHDKDGETLRTATDSDVRTNQSVLNAAIAKARLGFESRPVLLDAHSVIDNDEQLVDVPYAAIKPIGIAHFLFLAADPLLIVERRAGSGRARPKRSADVLMTHQRRALTVCQDYAQRSGRPITILQSPNGEENVQAALQIFKETIALRKES